MLSEGSRKDLLHLAVGLAASGNWRRARQVCMKLIGLRSVKAEALHLMGCIDSGEGNWSTGVLFLRRAARLRPQKIAWLRDLGVVLIAAGRPSEAAAAFRRCLAINQGDRCTLEHYALALYECGSVSAALAAYRRLLNVDPCCCEGLIGSARCFLRLGNLQEAAKLARRGLQLETENTEIHEILACIHNDLQEYESALSHCTELVRLKPGEPIARGQFAHALFFLGEIEKSVEIFRDIVPKVDNSNLHSVFLTVLLHDSRLSSSALTEAHRAWGQRYASFPKNVRKFANDRGSKRKLTLAYLIGEGATSPTMYFLKPILRLHNRRKFKVKVYYTDASIRRCVGRTLATLEATDSCGLTGAQLTGRILCDRIDVLVEVSGHYGSNLLVSAARAAPVQVSFPSYPASTGVSEMDYIFTDRWTCPPGQESQYLETPIELPSGYIVYDPPFRPRIPPLPASKNGFVTFGFFQRPAKLNAHICDLIAQVLHGVPRSQILFHHASADLHHSDSASRQRLIAALESRGIAGERCRFLGCVPVRRHLAAIATVDIALDSFPYTGQTTTCECIWMGVPVVTLKGETHVSRVSGSILSRVGLTEYIAVRPEEYVSIAVAAASGIPALATLRKQLRARFCSSTVFNGTQVVREMERAYDQMWQNWVNVQKSRRDHCRVDSRC